MPKLNQELSRDLMPAHQLQCKLVYLPYEAVSNALR